MFENNLINIFESIVGSVLNIILFFLQIFSKICFCLNDSIKILRLATASIYGLRIEGVLWNIFNYELLCTTTSTCVFFKYFSWFLFTHKVQISICQKILMGMKELNGLKQNQSKNLEAFNLFMTKHSLNQCYMAARIFWNNLIIQHNVAKYLKESCGFSSDQHFSLNYFLKNVLVRKSSPTKQNLYYKWNL